MADINNKPKIQLRPTLSINGDKSPSPATKLLISHGKPNFTIQRSPKIQNGNGSVSPLSNQISTKNEFVVKSTTFNGVFKPSNISVASKNSLKQNGDDNEAAKVVLRRTKVPEPPLKEGEDENVPEFIRRQRRIQERLAKENLDFENRRSGYFTHVVISPSSPNRKSFVETMSSPAIVPGLEIPPPVQPAKIEESEEEKKHEEQKDELLKEIAQEIVEEPKNGEVVEAAPVVQNGHDDAEEEEVNKAIEEVNKAVAGEDDDVKPEEVVEEDKVPEQVAAVTSAMVEESSAQNETPIQAAVVTSAMVDEPQSESSLQTAVVTSAPEEETKVEDSSEATVQAVVTSLTLEEESKIEEPIAAVQAVVTSALMVEEEEVEKPLQNGHVEAVVTSALVTEEVPKTNGVSEQNGHDEITISHTNALSTPSIPSPDPSGEKGVNYEPKTVVSFSKDLGEPNKYPDTVKVVKEVESNNSSSDELKELAKLKFEIKGDETADIEVTPVLKVE
uniref:Putative hybrid signal transduction histidine kinase e n=1 Tax=Haematobia irritans TaxID=7368 RepID=A0A1L8EJC2_HAEIR